MNKKHLQIVKQFAKYAEKHTDLSPEFLTDKWIDGLDTLENDGNLTAKERKELEQGLILSIRIVYTDKTGMVAWEN
jgi:hypothetical protein